LLDPRKLLDNLVGKHVVVVGDLMLDELARGDVRRISPEAPVPVLEVTSRIQTLGGAANAANNVVALGGRATIIGLLGDDDAANTVERMMKERGLAGSIVRDATRPTTQKTRFVARGQQIVRIDQESRAEASGAARAALLDTVRAVVPTADACIISDYAKGAIFRELNELLVATAKGKPVVADPKHRDISLYRGVTVVTPNHGELEEATHSDLVTDADFAGAAEKLRPALDGAAILATRGAEGMTLFEKGKPPVHVHAAAKSVFDVTGAGDTVVATLAIALAAGVPLAEAVRIASAAAGVVVSKVGTATVSPDELERALVELSG
jgi:D-beta-D-heptose 7-phosphate kinase/D-beta-D-heptose 1-phosphate adenosyltransferase